MTPIPKCGEAGNQGNEVMLGDRISQQRKKLNVSLEELSRKTGLSKAFLHEVEKGKKDITSRRLLLIGEALRCSVDYLLTGKKAKPAEFYAVEEYLEKVKASVLREAGRTYTPLSKDGMEILRELQKLPEEKKALIRRILRAFIEEHENEQKKNT